jgi:hypothetical protein
MILVTLFLAAQLAHRFAPTPAERSPVRVLNVCQLLQVLPEVQGQVVVVVGWSSDTSEGSWLGAECANRLVTDGFTWPNEVATSFGEAEFAPAPALPRGFRWPEPAISRSLLGLSRGPSSRASGKWLAIYGRLETHVPLQVGMCGGGPCGLGFGHGSAAPALIIFPEGGVREVPGP